MSVYEAETGRFTLQLRCFASDASRLLSSVCFTALSLEYQSSKHGLLTTFFKLETHNDNICGSEHKKVVSSDFFSISPRNIIFRKKLLGSMLAPRNPKQVSHSVLKG